MADQRDASVDEEKKNTNTAEEENDTQKTEEKKNTQTTEDDSSTTDNETQDDTNTEETHKSFRDLVRNTRGVVHSSENRFIRPNLSQLSERVIIALMVR